MEVYILDDQHRRVDVIDVFESLIWTERFRAFGDFQLDVLSTTDMRRKFPAGLKLAMNLSNRVMTVQSLEDRVDANGNKILTVTGPSIEGILEDRAAKKTMSDTTTEPKWTITDLPAAIARKIFHDICVIGSLNAGDAIYNVHESTFVTPASNIPEPTEEITVNLEPQTVYQALVDLCTTWNLGFRMLRQTDEIDLYFDIYAGCDRTAGQVLLPPVVFSPNLDNLQNTAELTSVAAFKNCAYVFSPNGHQVVYPDGIDPTIANFDRRVLVVNANDITDQGPDDTTLTQTQIDALLVQRGKDELAKNKGIQALDGEINQNSQYKYGVDYNLGDFVTMQNSDGVTNKMRVEEQIFVSDHEGERGYPTLTLDSLIASNTWNSWVANKVWDDMTTETWASI